MKFHGRMAGWAHETYSAFIYLRCFATSVKPGGWFRKDMPVFCLGLPFPKADRVVTFAGNFSVLSPPDELVS